MLAAVMLQVKRGKNVCAPFMHVSMDILIDPDSAIECTLSPDLCQGRRNPSLLRR